MIDGIGIFDVFTVSPGINVPRCIGNIIIKSKLFPKIEFVGFENHGGRTYINDKSLAFAQVIKGYGNNGQDKTEGYLFKNSIGTYIHGPILPKNPELTDYLIHKAVERKYGKGIKLKAIDNKWEKRAREFISF
jgi:hypothetical protein